MGVSVQPGILRHQLRSAEQLSTWTGRAAILWSRRAILLRVFAIAAPFSICVSLLIPKQYESIARIMPPDQNTSGNMLAAISARATGLGALGSLAAGLLGSRPSSALFISLLQSGTVSGDLVARFDLQRVYGKRYAIDAAKKLARRTKISDDKKSGVITIEVTDNNPVRARDLAQAYLDELNRLVIQTNNSSAHQERVFIEQRLGSVNVELERAQRELSDYASRTNAVDLKEQTHAMVDAGAHVEAALVMEQATLNSLRQVYRDGNFRVRQSEARISTLEQELHKVAGDSTPVDTDANSTADFPSARDELYPPLRQLPRLAVPYADLYRKVRVQEALYELLTQQYETSRIAEAKDTPVVSVIDRPGVPEKKSFPPRTIMALLLLATTMGGSAAWILVSQRWTELPRDHEARLLVDEIVSVLRRAREGAGA